MNTSSKYMSTTSGMKVVRHNLIIVVTCTSDVVVLCTSDLVAIVHSTTGTAIMYKYHKCYESSKALFNRCV